MTVMVVVVLEIFEESAYLIDEADAQWPSGKGRHP